MASFMTKKKKYKFHVELCLEELLEVPFVSAVLFAKMRLLDGGSFQDHSSRQEVRDHKVLWGNSFSFPCKMMANATTGVMERCVLRISIRKESKGGRSFNKLGFVDLNLAEFAGAGSVHKKALLEGYDARHRQDNSMLKFRIELSMTSGDVLFKAPSPTLNHRQMNNVEDATDEQRSEEASGASLAGSIASGSSGFGSLPKKRPALLPSDLVIGHTLCESEAPPAPDLLETPAQPVPPAGDADAAHDRPAACHSRNSSNTSQLSKASGYGSLNSRSHSRQSSSGDSGHMRGVDLPGRNHRKRHLATNGRPNKPLLVLHLPPRQPSAPSPAGTSTPLKGPASPFSDSSTDDFRTPEGSFLEEPAELQKSRSAVTVTAPSSLGAVLRSKSDFHVPFERGGPAFERGGPAFERGGPAFERGGSTFGERFFSSDGLFSFLTPRPKRKVTPKGEEAPATIRAPVEKSPEGRAISLSSLRSTECDWLHVRPAPRPMSHRKLLDGSAGSKLAPLAISPDEQQVFAAPDCCDDAAQQASTRRPSVTTNPSAGSLAISETGSLDRAKAAYDRRKKGHIQDADAQAVSGRVEITRVNPDDLIEELLKSTNLEQPDDSAETSGLQLFIAKDGTAALGNHEVKSQMSTGAQSFQQVVMDDR